MQETVEKHFEKSWGLLPANSENALYRPAQVIKFNPNLISLLDLGSDQETRTWKTKDTKELPKEFLL